MTRSKSPEIVIEGAKTNNLQNISLRIPHHQLIAVTGISGSGKSSLVFDLIAQEAQRRYFETLPTFARQFSGKLNRPEVDVIEGLSPVIAIGQQTSGMHARSTVGTLSDLYDFLRLLFARTGTTTRDIQLSRSLFSFNSLAGKCPQCQGIGQEEEIDLNRLIADPSKTIREGALAPTLPTGYIMYSQVTIDVLNQICEAEGFHVDIPWNQLTSEQQAIILYGSQKIKVPFGKHSLESRLKWTGIKAKPREEGFYKGMIPIMSDILRRDRNANILKYVHAITCRTCQGARLNQDALSVLMHGQSIAKVSSYEVQALADWIKSNEWSSVAAPITQQLLRRLEVLANLGLGHLTLNRPANTLRPGDIQRIRIANQILAPLSNVLYIFDEPSVGLHHTEQAVMMQYFRRLVNRGNTVMLVEHQIPTIRGVDHLIDIGPGAGSHGGTVLFNGPLQEFLQKKSLTQQSPTHRALTEPESPRKSNGGKQHGVLRLVGCHGRNLKHIDVSFQLGKLNVVSGKSGTGKFTLVKDTLVRLVQQKLGLQKTDESVSVEAAENLDAIQQLVYVSHAPIGKTPRSNPATYLGLADHIRDLFASLSEAKASGFTKSRFSFNNKGGRCETCQGAGKIQIGMHFLGKVDLTCGTCNGNRFNDATLNIRYKEKSIADCYRLSVDQAIDFFEGQPKILKGLHILQEIGLGYLSLGQSSTTLSGGEAQRIKIANQLQKKDTGDTLYVLIEPALGLHHQDIGSLMQLFDRLKRNGNTIVCIEQHETIIQSADWHIELGPKSGMAGGHIHHMGLPQSMQEHQSASALTINPAAKHQMISLQGVNTHGLKNLQVDFPKNQLSVVTGISGSGKSSLVYDTLYAEANARFTASLSTYHRSFLQQNNPSIIRSYEGLGPAIGIRRKKGTPNKRSTVGTLSGVYDAFRLLYSRIAQRAGTTFTAQHFSYNHHLGACPHCDGIGTLRKCNPETLIIAPEKSLLAGALSSNKGLAYYVDPHGQFMATLNTVAQHHHWDLNQPWNELSEEIQYAVLYGTGDQSWEVTWHFKTKTKTGTQNLTAKWLGLCTYIEDEYQRRLHNKNIEHLSVLLHDVTCTTCQGSRLKPDLLGVQFLQKNIHELTQLTISDSLTALDQQPDDPVIQQITAVVLPGVKATLKTMHDLGLGHLQLNRAIHTLSGGEWQRVTLSGQLSTHLYGVTYVLDEPSIGLDVQQVTALVNVLQELIRNGNTVVVVEHDPDFIRSADYVVEMGPGAGSMGGEIVFQGPTKNIQQHIDSATYQLLHASAIEQIKPNQHDTQTFGIKEAASHNLKHIDVTFQSGQVTAITGVSGSGKSSLIREVLYQSWLRQGPINCQSVHGLEAFEAVEWIDQDPLTQSRLSSPALYLGLLDALQGLFSKTEQAKQRGFKKADFSYQSKRGKCPTCSGHGAVKTSMDFMSDLWLTCDTCQGLRYHQDILTVTYQEKNIGEILQLTILEAISIFQETLSGPLQLLINLGLGHLQLGQSFNTLSGGETQRLKLAKSLLNNRKGSALYLFDEPSTGLHYLDLRKLIRVFQSLIDRGDTLIFIEHNQTLIQAANQVINLGPGSGDNGGWLV